jgi:pyridoxal phosphate enzyme (YggS family)
MTSKTALKNDVCARFADVDARIRLAAGRCNRSATDITIIAITKTHPPERVREALACGARDFGENRIQEAEEKILEVGRSQARWHLVGHLQANKARRALKLFDVIHSVDSLELAQRLDRLCEEEGRDLLPVLVQVKLGEEETKSGVHEKDLFEVVHTVKSFRKLQLIGLMTVPPYFDDPEKVRPFFKRLREFRDQLKQQGSFAHAVGELSMGMTHDFEVAIEEGATMVRIGTAIFGERPTTD